MGNSPPEIIFSSVDLPEPFAPVIANLLPVGIVTVSSEKTGLWLNALLSFCIDRSIDRVVCSETAHDASFSLIDKLQDQFLFRPVRNRFLYDLYLLGYVITPDK